MSSNNLLLQRELALAAMIVILPGEISAFACHLKFLCGKPQRHFKMGPLGTKKSQFLHFHCNNIICTKLTKYSKLKQLVQGTSDELRLFYTLAIPIIQRKKLTL